MFPKPYSIIHFDRCLPPYAQITSDSNRGGGNVNPSDVKWA